MSFASSLGGLQFACFMRGFPDDILKIARKILVKLQHRRVIFLLEIQLIN